MDFLLEAQKLMEENKSDQAVKIIEEYLPLASDEEKFSIIEFYLSWGFQKQSIPLLKDLLNQYPEENELKIMLANIYIEQDDDKKAIDLLDDIDKRDPYYEQALLLQADLYQALGLFEVTEQKLLTAKRANPQEPIIDLALGEFYFSIADYARASLYYERLHEQSIDELAEISILSRMAETLAGLGEYEKALAIYEEFTSDEPDTLFKYGLTAYQTGNIELSIQLWENVLEIDEFYHSVYEWLAKAYEVLEDYEKAYKTSIQGLTYDEFNKELYYLTGNLAYKLQKYEDSEGFLKQALDLAPDYTKALKLLIDLYKDQEEHHKIIEEILSNKDKDALEPLFLWELARAHEALEAYEKAREYFEQAFDLLKDNARFLYEYADFFMEEGETKKALSIFKKYLQLEPEDQDVREFILRIEEQDNLI